MQIYFFRHGEAVPKDDPSISTDADRPLVAEGIRRTRQAAEGMKQMGIFVDAVLTSPWIRARQTAQIACEVLGLDGLLEEMPELAGDRKVEEVLTALPRYSHLESAMLVGHNPLLPGVAAYLLSLSAGMQIDLKKSGICAIEVERIPPKNPGTLLWLMTARQLRAMR